MAIVVINSCNISHQDNYLSIIMYSLSLAPCPVSTPRKLEHIVFVFITRCNGQNDSYEVAVDAIMCHRGSFLTNTYSQCPL